MKATELLGIEIDVLSKKCENFKEMFDSLDFNDDDPVLLCRNYVNHHFSPAEMNFITLGWLMEKSERIDQLEKIREILSL